MKNTITSLFILLILTSCSLQNKNNFNEAIRADFLNYIDKINNKELEEVLKYTPRKVLELIPKKYLLEVLEEQINNLAFDYKVDSVKMNYLKDTIIDKSDYYQLYDVTKTINFKMHDTTGIKEVEKNFKNYFGDNVKYNKGNNSFEYIEKEKIVFIKNRSDIVWTFINYEEIANKDSFLNSVIPEEVLLCFRSVN